MVKALCLYIAQNMPSVVNIPQAATPPATGEVLWMRGRFNPTSFVALTRTLSMPKQYQLEGEMTAKRQRLVGFEASIETTQHGPEIKTLTLTPSDGSALRVSDIRSVRFNEILSQAANAVALQRTEQGGSIDHSPISDDRYRFVKGTFGHLKKGPKKISRVFLEDVAQVWLHAEHTGTYSVLAVMDAFNAPRGTVNKWLEAARLEGLIPPARRGRPPGRKRSDS